MIVVMKSERLMNDDMRIENKTGFLQTFSGTRMAGIENRHVIFFSQRIDGRKQRPEVLFRIDVFFPVRGKNDIFSGLQSEPFKDIRLFNRFQIGMQHLGHRRTRHKSPLLRKAAFSQVPAGVFGIGHVDIGNDINDPPVRFLRQALVLAAVSRLHMKDRDVQSFGGNRRKAGIRIPEDKKCIRADPAHQLIGSIDDVADCFPQIFPDRIHIDFRVLQFQVMEENAVQAVIIILSRMGQNRIEILPAFFDHGGKPDDFRPCADDNQKLQFSVFTECDIRIILFHCHFHTSS